MLDLRIDDVSPNLDYWLQLLAVLGGNTTITYDDFWEVVRDHENMPDFSNAYQTIVLERLQDAIRLAYPNAQVSFFVNNIDTHLHVNNQIVFDIDDLHYATNQAA